MNIEVEINAADRELLWSELRAFVELGRGEHDDQYVLVRAEPDGTGGSHVSIVLLDVDERALLLRAASSEPSSATDVEWAVVDGGRVIHIADATCPADVLAGAHGHGTHGPVGVARRTVTRTQWEHLEGSPS